jgi:hypothetical protein
MNERTTVVNGTRHYFGIPVTTYENANRELVAFMAELMTSPLRDKVVSCAPYHQPGFWPEVTLLYRATRRQVLLAYGLTEENFAYWLYWQFDHCA